MNPLRQTMMGLTALLVGALSGHAAVAVLEWNPNGETNLAGYRVHAGSASRAYEFVADVGDARQCHHRKLGVQCRHRGANLGDGTLGVLTAHNH